jgi:predicted MFS family arabinose efflux permease
MLVCSLEVVFVFVMQGISGFYKAFGLDELGYNDEFLSMVGAAAGVANCMGRIILGFLVDRVPYRLVLKSFLNHVQCCIETVVLRFSSMFLNLFSDSSWITHSVIPNDLIP